MNALLPLFTAAAGDAADQKAANLLAAARALTPHLNRSRPLDRKLVSGVMTTTFGASDAEGAWLWRDAYDAIEAALVLQLRRLAPQIGRLEDAPAEITALLASLSALSLTHTRRSEEQTHHRCYRYQDSSGTHHRSSPVNGVPSSLDAQRRGPVASSRDHFCRG